MDVNKKEILDNLMKPRPLFGSMPKAHTPRPAGDGKQLVVGKDIKLSGDIDVCDSLVVEGTLEANLSGARYLDIVYGGKFKGLAVIEEAHISGNFDGELKVSGCLYLYNGGVIKGKVEYASLIVEKGGVINGTVKQMDVLPENK